MRNAPQGARITKLKKKGKEENKIARKASKQKKKIREDQWIKPK